MYVDILSLYINKKDTKPMKLIFWQLMVKKTPFLSNKIITKTDK